MRSNPLRLDRLDPRLVPAVFTVTTTLDTWDSAAGLSLRQAIARANDSPGLDEVRFALPDGSTIRLDIAGLGRLPAVVDPLSVVGPGADRLAVSGSRQGRVFGFLPSAGQSYVSGLTLADGFETGYQAASGAVFNAADLTLTDVAVVNSVATTDVDIGRGGGLFNAPEGVARLVRTRFEGNQAPDGGAIYNLGTLFLTDSVLVNNRADVPPTATEFTASGGAIFNKSDNSPAAVTAVNTRFVGNTGLDRGGGIYTDGGQVTITGGEIANNVLRQAGALGGGLFADKGAVVRLTDVAVTGNRTAGDGGGVYTTITGDSVLDRVRVEGNRADGTGGGVYHQSNTGGLLTVTRSVVRDNSAGVSGGGVASNNFAGPDAPFTLLDGLTLTGNAAPEGAGLQSLGRPSAMVTGSELADGAGGVAVFAARNTGQAAGSYESVGRFTAYGTGAGVSGVVRLVRPGQADLRFSPFEASFVGGVRVAVADVDRDGTDDVMVGAGPGGGPRVVVYSGFDGRLVADFFAFEPSFRNGVHVGSAGSVRLVDGRPVRTSLLTVGAGDGGPTPGDPRVRAFVDFQGVPNDGSVGDSPIDFYAYNLGFQGGVRVAAADLAGDGTIQLVTVPGPGGGPDLRVWDVNRGIAAEPLLRQQLAGLGGDDDYRGGGYVTASGGTVMVGPDGIGRLPQVYVFTPAGGGKVAETPQLVGLGDDFRDRVRVSAGAGGLATGYGQGGRGRVQDFDLDPAAGTAAAVGDTLPFGDLSPLAGVYVGLASVPGATG